MSKHKILVIDDSFLIRKSLVDQLSGERFEVFEAKDGPSGLAKAEEVNPDVILLDFVMPGMNGYEVYQALRANPKFVNTPVIVISSSYDEVVNKFGYPFVGFDFLAKQFTKEQLEERINAVLPMIASSPEHVGIAVTHDHPAVSAPSDMLQQIQAQLTEMQQQLQKIPVGSPETVNNTPVLNQLQALEAQIQTWMQRPPADTSSGHFQELSQELAQVQQKQATLLAEMQNLHSKLLALETQMQHSQLAQDTLTQLVSSLQHLNQNIVHLPRTDAVLERLAALEGKLATTAPPRPNLALLIGAVAVGAFVGAAVGASVVGGQRQSQSWPPVSSSIAAVTLGARSG